MHAWQADVTAPGGNDSDGGDEVDAGPVDFDIDEARLMNAKAWLENALGWVHNELMFVDRGITIEQFGMFDDALSRSCDACQELLLLQAIGKEA